MSPSNGFQNNGGGGGGNGLNYIEHQVSKLDTLAGVAIKYGVEVQPLLLIFIFFFVFFFCLFCGHCSFFLLFFFF